MWIDDTWRLTLLYLVSLSWQITAFPFLCTFFRHLNDCGWAIGRIATTIFVSLVIWTLANFGLNINTNDGLLLVVSIINLISFYFWRNNFNRYIENVKEMRLLIYAEEALIFFCIIFMGLMRGFRPEINSIEKFMDFGFIKQYLLSGTLPAPDMWFAGSSINYYSFGHFWLSIMIRWLGVIPEIGYNLMVAFIFSIVTALSFSIVVNILDHRLKKLTLAFGGLISSLLIVLGGNSHILWFVIKNKGLWDGIVPYWYAVSTRFLDKTITEFPAYTFAIADLHAHLIDLPIVMTFILIAIADNHNDNKKNLSYIYSILLGILLGIMAMTNTWDAGIYLMFLGIFKLIKLIKKEIGINQLLFQAMFMVMSSVVTSALWWHSFVLIPQGVKMVSERSLFWKLLVTWGAQWFIGLMAVLFLYKRPIILAIVITAIILTIIPEFIYVVDILSSTPRMNTVFKLTYQSFVLFSLLGGIVTVELVKEKKYFLLTIIFIVFFALFLYPFTSYKNYYLNFINYRGLDGGIWLKDERPTDYQISEYLKVNNDGRALIEYPGNSFTLSNSVSVYSGVPVVLGWRSHEWLWRGLAPTQIRIGDVELFYSADIATKRKIINKYNIGWIKISEEERSNLILNEDKIKLLGEVVLKNNDNYLIKIK